MVTIETDCFSFLRSVSRASVSGWTRFPWIRISGRRLNRSMQAGSRLTGIKDVPE